MSRILVEVGDNCKDESYKAQEQDGEAVSACEAEWGV